MASLTRRDYCQLYLYLKQIETLAKTRTKRSTELLLQRSQSAIDLIEQATGQLTFTDALITVTTEAPKSTRRSRPPIIPAGTTPASEKEGEE